MNRRVAPFVFVAVAALFALPLRAASADDLVASAVAQVGVTRTYDPSYRVLAYPNGDVPLDRGVCSDVVIRAFRGIGIDLQRLVHEDMRAHFDAYPHSWGLRAPDRNIDHRRVPNLAVFFTRRGKSLPVTARGADYAPGDVVVWRLPGFAALPHIGIVSQRRVPGTDRYAVVHNIGAGAQVEDVLFSYAIAGHFRWFETSIRRPAS